MKSKTKMSQSTKTEPPLHEQAFEWPRQAMREQNWREAALRWKVLRQAYPEHPATWLQGANAHIEAGDFEQAEILLTHARLEYPEHP
ncbi:MAG: tetratricopeptide repeat protein, partial [Thiotrichaceae bacterium]|nr:tetratricopeptide repeat protein [Thiotrichaceae bacterium]